MAEVTIPFDATTCPNPADTIIAMNTRVTEMLNVLQGFVCERDAESIERHNTLVAALTALRDNTSTAVNDLSALVSSDAAGLAAARLFITENQTAIDGLVAAIATNTAAAAANTTAATANTASAAANVASTAANTALLATVESLANGVKVSADALADRASSLEANQAAIQASIAAQATRIEDLETAPQGSVSVAAIEAENVAQGLRLDTLEADTSALDYVCALSKAMQAAIATLPSTATEFAACVNDAATVIPTMALNAAAAPVEGGAAEL